MKVSLWMLLSSCLTMCLLFQKVSARSVPSSIQIFLLLNSATSFVASWHSRLREEKVLRLRHLGRGRSRNVRALSRSLVSGWFPRSARTWHDREPLRQLSRSVRLPRVDPLWRERRTANACRRSAGVRAFSRPGERHKCRTLPSNSRRRAHDIGERTQTPTIAVICRRAGTTCPRASDRHKGRQSCR